MQTPLLAAALVLTVPSLSVAPERLEFAPHVGLPLRYEHEVQHVLTTRTMRSEEAGTEHVVEGGFDALSKLELFVTEVILEQGSGRPERFRRIYDRARLGVDVQLLQLAEQKLPRLETTGSFEGKSVAFTWVEEEQQYARHFDAEEWVEEDLPRLGYELGLSGFLPSGEVEPGATWSVDPLELRHVVGPGGFVGFDLSAIGDPSFARTLRGGLGTHMHEAFAEVLEGELRATYRGRREVEGRDLAVIELRYEVTARADLTALMNRARTIQELDAGFSLELYQLTLVLDGEGEILWDTRGAHLASARFLGEEKVLARMSATAAQRVVQEIELEGSFTSEVRARAEPDHEPAPDWRAKDRR